MFFVATDLSNRSQARSLPFFLFELLALSRSDHPKLVLSCPRSEFDALPFPFPVNESLFGLLTLHFSNDAELTLSISRGLKLAFTSFPVIICVLPPTLEVVDLSLCELISVLRLFLNLGNNLCVLSFELRLELLIS